MPPRLSAYQRDIRNQCDQLDEVLTSITLAELQRLWRHLRAKIMRIEAIRPQAPALQKGAGLAKQYTISQGLWDLFRQHLHDRLLTELMAGTITLDALHAQHLERLLGDPAHIDTGELARAMESELATRITRTTAALQRKVANRIVGWYNSPGSTVKDLLKELSPEFDVVRASLIGQTEVTRLNSKVQDAMAAKLGIGEWWWDTRNDQDVCVRRMRGPDGAYYKGCHELHGKRFPIGTPMPPDASHPGCRCSPILVLPKRTIAAPTPPIVALPYALGKAAQFDESKHPRDKGGEFTSKGGEGGGGAASETKPIQAEDILSSPIMVKAEPPEAFKDYADYPELAGYTPTKSGYNKHSGYWMVKIAYNKNTGQFETWCASKGTGYVLQGSYNHAEYAIDQANTFLKTKPKTPPQPKPEPIKPNQYQSNNLHEKIPGMLYGGEKGKYHVSVELTGDGKWKVEQYNTTNDDPYHLVSVNNTLDDALKAGDDFLDNPPLGFDDIPTPAGFEKTSKGWKKHSGFWFTKVVTGSDGKLHVFGAAPKEGWFPVGEFGYNDHQQAFEASGQFLKNKKSASAGQPTPPQPEPEPPEPEPGESPYKPPHRDAFLKEAGDGYTVNDKPVYEGTNGKRYAKVVWNSQDNQWATYYKRGSWEDAKPGASYATLKEATCAEEVFLENGIAPKGDELQALLDAEPKPPVKEKKKAAGPKPPTVTGISQEGPSGKGVDMSFLTDTEKKSLSTHWGDSSNVFGKVGLALHKKDANSVKMASFVAKDSGAAGIMSGTDLEKITNASYSTRGATKDRIAKALSSFSGVSYAKTSAMIQQWAWTSNDNHIDSLNLQKTVSEEFGVKMSTWQKSNLKKVEGDHAAFSDVERQSFIKAMYSNTQAVLQGGGFKPDDEITMFRGTGALHAAGVKSEDANIGDDVDIIGNAAESWSVDPSVAARFGQTVLVTKVKVRDVLGCCVSGFGCLTENEFVVLAGRKYSAKVLRHDKA